MIDEEKILSLIENFQPYTSAETTSIILNYAKLKNNIDRFRDDKTVYVLVGPSGSGKSTLIANMYENNVFGNSENDFVPFINRHFTDKSMSLAQEIAFKNELLSKGKSFMIESAKFDENYSDFIKLMKIKYGYKICLIYLTKWHPQENISMVQKRKREGGHGSKQVELSEKVISEMYVVDSKNLMEIMPYCDSCFVINNETQTKNKQTKPIILLQKKLNGEIVYDKEFRSANFLYRKILKSNIKRKPIVVRKCKLANYRIKSGFKLTSQSYVYIQQPLTTRIEAILAKLKNMPISDDMLDLTEIEIERILKGQGKGKK